MKTLKKIISYQKLTIPFAVPFMIEQGNGVVAAVGQKLLPFAAGSVSAGAVAAAALPKASMATAAIAAATTAEP